jgi:hypothetical protein
MQKYPHKREQIVNLANYGAGVLIIGNMRVVLRDFDSEKWFACGKIGAITAGHALIRQFGARRLTTGSVLARKQRSAPCFSRSGTNFARQSPFVHQGTVPRCVRFHVPSFCATLDPSWIRK